MKLYILTLTPMIRNTTGAHPGACTQILSVHISIEDARKAQDRFWRRISGHSSVTIDDIPDNMVARIKIETRELDETSADICNAAMKAEA